MTVNIFTGFRGLRYPDIHPDRLGGACLDITDLYDIQYIGYDGGIPFRLILSVAATAFTVFIQLIGHDVTDKVRRDSGGWDDGRTAL